MRQFFLESCLTEYVTLLDLNRFANFTIFKLNHLKLYTYKEFNYKGDLRSRFGGDSGNKKTFVDEYPLNRQF